MKNVCQNVKFLKIADDTVLISLIREGKKCPRGRVRTKSTWGQAPPSLSSTTDCKAAVDTFQDPGNHHLPGLGHLTWPPSSKMPSRWCSSCSSHNVLPSSGESDPLRLCSATKQERHRLEGTMRTQTESLVSNRLQSSSCSPPESGIGQ